MSRANTRTGTQRSRRGEAEERGRGPTGRTGGTMKKVMRAERSAGTVNGTEWAKARGVIETDAVDDREKGTMSGCGEAG